MTSVARHLLLSPSHQLIRPRSAAAPVFEFAKSICLLRDLSREPLSESFILMGLQDVAGVECFI